MDQKTRYYRISEASAALGGISEETLRRHFREGRIPGRRVGKVILVDADWIDLPPGGMEIPDAEAEE